MGNTIDFFLPLGLEVDGKIHRQGKMHLTTTKDELEVQLSDESAINSRYRDILLLASVIDCIGELTDISKETIMDLYEADFLYLQLLYKQVNEEKPITPLCPVCSKVFSFSLTNAFEGQNHEKNLKIRKEFRFTLPKGTGIKVEDGHKVLGNMRLVKVKDIVMIERDSSVQKNSGAFYIVLIAKVIVSLGAEKNINRSTIEKMNPVDFAFLADFMHEINHQVIKTVHLKCPHCNTEYSAEFEKLGEA